jgi:hypothetical protein
MELLLILLGLFGGPSSGDTPGGPIVHNAPITMQVADHATTPIDDTLAN